MTKEEIYKNYLKDPLLFEKRLLSNTKAESLKFSDPTDVKLLEVIKVAISGTVDQEPQANTVRKITSLLNVKQNDH